MEGWLIIGRFGSVPDWFDYVADPEAAPVPKDLRRKRKAVLHAYRGVDGHPWFDKEENKPPLLSGGLAPPADFLIVEHYYRQLPLVEPHKDLLYVQKIVRPLSITLPDGFVFLGFEFAEYESEPGVYSSLYHEVFWEPEPAMHRFAKRLNAHLLCDSLADVAEMGAMTLFCWPRTRICRRSSLPALLGRWPSTDGRGVFEQEPAADGVQLSGHAPYTTSRAAPHPMPTSGKHVAGIPEHPHNMFSPRTRLGQQL